MQSLLMTNESLEIQENLPDLHLNRTNVDLDSVAVL